MANLVSTSERAVLTGIFDSIFETFQRPIVVYKEPIKTRVLTTSVGVFGFGDSQQDDTYTYTEVTGVFPATVRYEDQITDLNPEINSYLSAGQVRIKVKSDCREFINQGKTEKFLVDGRTFYLDGDERKQTFLDSQFYIFTLKATK